MFFPFELLLVDEFSSRCDDAVLRFDMRGVGSTRLGCRLGRTRIAKTTPDRSDLQAGGKTFQITFLLVGEVHGEGFDFHRLWRTPAANGLVTNLFAGRAGCPPERDPKHHQPALQFKLRATASRTEKRAESMV